VTYYGTTNKATGSAVHKWLQGSHKKYSVSCTASCSDVLCIVCSIAAKIKQNIIQQLQRLKDSKTGMIQFSETRTHKFCREQKKNNPETTIHV